MIAARLLATLGLLAPLMLLAIPDDAHAQVGRVRSKDTFSEQWEVLYASETSMSITGDDPVLDRRFRNDAANKIYSEAMKLPGGGMRYEKRKGTATQDNGTAESELVKRYGAVRELESFGIKITQDAVRKVSTEMGDVAVLQAESKSHRCAFFFHYANGSDGKAEGQSQALTGGLCSAASAPEAQNLEKALLEVLSRVLFDGGAYAYSQKFAQGLNQARRRALEEEVSYQNDKVPPTLETPPRLTTNEALVTIKGTASDDVELAEVRVNGLWASVGPSGNFKLTIPVQSGESQITVVAKDRAGNKVQKIVSVMNTGAGPGLPQVKSIPFGKDYALIIANQNYNIDPKIGSLDTAANDGVSVADVLKERYGFNVTLLPDARKEDIIAAFNKLADTLRPEDNLLIYYAGHGTADYKLPGKPGYWIPVDGTTADSTNWLPNRTIVRAINAIPAGHILIVADSCYSGTLTKEDNIINKRSNLHIRDAVARRTRTALSSGDFELVIDRLEDTDKNSVFAKEFVTLLRENPGTMSGLQVSNMLRGLVRRRLEQTPQYGAVLSAGHDDESDFFFRVRP